MTRLKQGQPFRTHHQVGKRVNGETEMNADVVAFIESTAGCLSFDQLIVEGHIDRLGSDLLELHRGVSQFSF